MEILSFKKLNSFEQIDRINNGNLAEKAIRYVDTASDYPLMFDLYIQCELITQGDKQSH